MVKNRILSGRVLKGRILESRVLKSRVLADEVLPERVLPNRILGSKTFHPHKKFQIESWLKQTDVHSCGYHLIHNAHLYLPIPEYEGSPKAVKEAINELRAENGHDALSEDNNLPSADLAKYFLHHGFKVDQFSNPYTDLPTIERVLDPRDFKLIYLTANQHYTGIVPDENSLLHLDSLLDGPRGISIRQAEREIVKSLGMDGNRYNLVGIVQNV